jgi:hypothetical protein
MRGSSRCRRVRVAAALAAASSVLAGVTFPAAPAATVRQNFVLLGHTRLGGKAPDGDVFFFDHRRGGKHAYVGTWRRPCTSRGVKIVDVNDPTAPRVVAVAALKRTGYSYEDVSVLRVVGKDVLAVGLQSCGNVWHHPGGVALFDVTRPAHPKKLSFTSTGHRVHGVHELDVVKRRDGRALALLAVPFSEQYASRGDFQIVEITHPAHPRRLADWGVLRNSDLKLVRRPRPVGHSSQGLGHYPAHYGHSARATDGGMTAYVSYWDGGVLKFDISRPAHPKLLGHTRYPIDADGDAHSMTRYRSGGETYILQNDEDLDAPSPAVIETSASGSTRFQGLEIENVPTQLRAIGQISDDVWDAGKGCADDAFLGANGRIALIDLDAKDFSGCGIGKRLLGAARAGAVAVMINRIDISDPRDHLQMSREARATLREEAKGMPVVVLAAEDGVAQAIRSQLSPVPATATLTPNEPAWGYLRIFKESGSTDVDDDGVTDFTEVGSFSDAPHVTGEPSPPPGDWTIHNTEVLGDRAYSSWYSNGVVAIDLSDPTAPRRVGRFVTPASDRRSKYLPDQSSKGSYPLVWGVAIDRSTGILYLSDMRTGLWIVRPVGEAAAADLDG